MKKPFYRLFIGLILLTQSSCVGISVVLGTNQIEQDGSIGEYIGEHESHRLTTTADVIRRWGKPKRKTVVGSREIWRYRSDEFSWRGMEVWAIIPIPLLLPTGFKKVTLEFEEGILTSYTIDRGRERFFGLFIMPGDDNDLLHFNKEETSSDCHGYFGCH